MISQENSSTNTMAQWALLALRLFLGITFVYAGIQKLTDPQFFRPSAAGYIGKQVAAFAINSPIHGLLIQIVEPHATLFGILVTYGEIAIGFGTLFGFLFRPAAVFGLLINLIFFLSATWRVYPYFYGSDIVFIFCWLALLINGPQNTGLPTFDEILFSSSSASSAQQEEGFVHTLHVLLGVAEQAQSAAWDNQANQKLKSQRGRQSSVQQARQMRRNFLVGVFTGGVGTVALLGLGYVLRIIPHGSASNTASSGATLPAASTAGSGGTAEASATTNVIA